MAPKPRTPLDRKHGTIAGNHRLWPINHSKPPVKQSLLSFESRLDEQERIRPRPKNSQFLIDHALPVVGEIQNEIRPFMNRHNLYKNFTTAAQN